MNNDGSASGTSRRDVGRRVTRSSNEGRELLELGESTGSNSPANAREESVNPPAVQMVVGVACGPL